MKFASIEGSLDSAATSAYLTIFLPIGFFSDGFNNLPVSLLSISLRWMTEFWTAVEIDYGPTECWLSGVMFAKAGLFFGAAGRDHVCSFLATFMNLLSYTWATVLFCLWLSICIYFCEILNCLVSLPIAALDSFIFILKLIFPLKLVFPYSNLKIFFQQIESKTLVTNILNFFRAPLSNYASGVLGFWGFGV